MNSAEEKLRILAQTDATLVAKLGSGPFRWFFVQLPQGYISRGSCLRLRRVSAVYTYAQEGITQIEQVRFQFDCLDRSRSAARDLLNALTTWLGGVDLMSDDQFQSPPVTPTQFPNYQLSQRSSIEYQVEQEIYVESADWRVFNNLSVS